MLISIKAFLLKNYEKYSNITFLAELKTTKNDKKSRNHNLLYLKYRSSYSLPRKVLHVIFGFQTNIYLL